MVRNLSSHPDKTIKALAIARVFYFAAWRACSVMRRNKKPVAGDNRQGFNCFDYPLLRSPQVILIFFKKIFNTTQFSLLQHGELAR